MRQRVGLAAALARDPELLIADEPSTALDVTTQYEILQLINSLQDARGMALILITHDLRVAFSVCHEIAVLYAGTLLELGDAHTLEAEPRHPYTLGLLLSEPAVDRRLAGLSPISGTPSKPDDVVGKCAFEPRCDWAREQCGHGAPPLLTVDTGTKTACIRSGEIREEMQLVRESWGQQTSEPPADSTEIAEVPDPILAVRMLTKTYSRGRKRVTAVRDVSISIGRGESVGLVGESGSGKTTIARCVVGLEDPTAGEIVLDGLTIARFDKLTSAQLMRARSTVQIVFQDPYSSLTRCARSGPRSLRRCSSRRACQGKRSMPRQPGCSNWSVFRPSTASASRARSPAENGNGSRSRAPWPSGRASWSATSPSPHSTCPFRLGYSGS